MTATLITESEHAKFQKLEAAAAKAAQDADQLRASIADREGQWHSLCESLAGLVTETKIARGKADNMETEIAAHWGHARGTQGLRGTGAGEHARIVGELAVLVAAAPLYETLAAEKEEQLKNAIANARKTASELGIDRQHWPPALRD